jgi:hypothetical protein
MPSGATQQIDRLVDARLNNGTGDVLPGLSVSSGTGQSSYGGNLGSRLAIDAATIRSNAAVGTLLGGIYQYVFMTYTTRQPLRGGLVFWDLAVGETLFQVNGDAKPTAAVPTLIAGVVINSSVVAGTYAWMQIGGRASCLFDSAITAAAAGNGVTAKISAAVASTCDVGTALAASTAGAIAGVDTLIGLAETTPVVSTISVVQLNNTLAFRRI